ncbi:hypothetical protein LUZ60_001185 [Juncus effusus]|nr:hypothetical protein LUZ60_001185 [Juncus effusus]
MLSGATNGGNQTDLLVCFPSRAHLALMPGPKPICSPSRPADQPKKHHHTTKPTKQNSTRGRASPLFKTKNRDASDDMDEEPTSPKVTCAGQIKVKPTKPRTSNASSRPSTDKNWISVVEEIERIRESRKKKPTSWLEAIGIKKDALHIFSSLHGLRFSMGCFGSFPRPIDCTSDEEEEEEEEELEIKEEEASSSDVFSKWFMLIEQNNDLELKEDIAEADKEEGNEEKDEKFDEKNSSVPPPNALLLMRCRSAPAKGLLSRTEEVETETEEVVDGKMVKEENKLEKEKLVVLSYAPDFFKVSMDIAKETWVVGGDRDFFTRSRSRSTKR